MNTLVEILNETEDGKQLDLVAKIIRETEKTFTVRYLSPTLKKHGDLFVYKYENVMYEVDKECISGYYDSTNEEDAGFTRVEGGWIRQIEDEDYEPSESDSE